MKIAIEGGNAGDAMNQMTDKYIMTKLLIANNAKQPMVANMPKRDGKSEEKIALVEAQGLILNHSYAIVDVDFAGQRLKLYNPWGDHHPGGDGWVTIDLIKTYFKDLNINA